VIAKTTTFFAIAHDLSLSALLHFPVNPVTLYFALEVFGEVNVNNIARLCFRDILMLLWLLVRA